MIAVIIPAHNEEYTIRKVVTDVHTILNNTTHQIIVTCDRCVDSTEQIARDSGAETITSTDPGLAGSYRTGIRRALSYNPDRIVHIDADGQYEPKDIPQMLLLLDKGCDMVLGNRITRRPDGMSVTKYILNHIGSASYSLLLLRHIADITDGLRVFNRKVALLPTLSRYTFTQEQVWRAVKAGYTVQFTAVSFYRRTNGDSRLMRHPLEYLTRSLKDFRRFAL